MLVSFLTRAEWLKPFFVLLIAALLVPAATAQMRAVTGTVVDGESGFPLPGVNVSVEGTSQGTATDEEGRYSLDVPGPEAVLAFSFVGYETQRVTVGDSEVIDVTLEVDLDLLDEIVVVGYGTERRIDVTGAISQVDAADFARVPAVSPFQALQGRSPGLRIITNSGEPGSSASIRIRGEQSISGSNTPIFVVDGTITTNIDHLDSQDIESVSVLKDASAVAIYGSRAANGVILVTTKRGARNVEPRINVHTYGGYQQESNLRTELLNSDEWLTIYTEAYENAGATIPWDDQLLAEYSGINTDWVGAIRRPGYLTNTDISLSGGSDRSNYFVSAGYLGNRGMVEGLDYKRYKLRFNSDHRINSWVKFGNSLNLYSSQRNANAGQYYRALVKVPLTRMYEEDGSWGRIRNTTLEHQHSNALWLAQNNVRDRDQRGAIGNVYLTLDLLEGLSFTTRGNVEWTNQYWTNFYPGIDPAFQWEGSNVNEIEKDNRETLFWQTDFLLDYARQFGSIHNVTGLLGYSLEEQTYERLFASGTGTPSNEIRFLSAADPTSLRSDNTYSDWAFQSVFGRVGYTLMDRYIVSATVRRDGTSRLSADQRYGVFPSVSAGWRIGEEGFMDAADWIDELKLRGSIGTVGNVLSIGAYGTKASLTNWNYVLNQQEVQGYTLASAVNTDLRWESTTKKNLGLDLELFDHRLYGTVDLFVEDTYDLLFAQPIPSSTGLVGSPFNNAGQIQNSGYEVVLGYRQSAGDWNYDFNVNFAHISNEVIDLDGQDLRTSGIEEGYPLRSYFGYRSNGLIRTQEDLENHPHFPGKEIGDIWLMDINGVDADGNLTGEPDGVVDANDRALLGDNYPNLVYGMMGTVGFKNWTMQVQLQGVQGIMRDIRVSGDLGTLHYFTQFAKNHDRLILDRFHPVNNPDGIYPRVTIADTGNNLSASDFWLDDASYLRVSNVNLNYRLPARLMGRVGAVESASAYVSVQNLYTMTSFYGPEVDTNADVLTGVPQPRTWTLGLRVGL